MNKVIYSLGASISSKLIILLINIISFRYILPDEYGFLALILALTATIGAVSNMGASVAVNSFVAKNKNTNLSKLYVKSNYILSTFLSLFLSTLVFFLSVDRQGDISDLGVYLFLFLFTLFSAYNSISEAVLNGMKSFDKIFVNNLINFFIFLPVSIFFIYQFNVFGVFLSLILYRFSLFIFNFYSANKILNTPKIKLSKYELNIIKNSFRNLTLPVIFSGILVAPIIGFSFKLMSSQQDGYENLAYFNIIYQMYLVAVFIPNALNGYLISKFSSENGKKDFSKIAKYNIGFSIIVALMLFLFKDLYFYIIDSKNDVIINNFYIMLLTIIFFSVNAIFASFWPSVSRAWFGMWMNLVWAVTLLSVTYILSSQNVAESLAWGFLASYLILTIVQTLFYKAINREKSKTIWILLRSHVVNLPPIMTVIQCLLDFKEYEVKFISTQESGLKKENFQEFILPQSHQVNKLRKLKNYIDYRSFVKKTLSKFASNEDLIWLGSLDTARACKGLEFLETNEYILHLHELYDTHRNLLESIKPIAQKAKKVISPEINRAAILQVWLELKERPVVFPNKPYFHPRTKRMKPTHEKTKAILEKFATDKLIVLYQGHIGGDRNLMPIAEAMKELPEYEFWLMGPDHGYVENLVKISNNIKYLGSVPAPFHLEITSYASIGIMSYDLINLNNLYCAPNKVWEYAGFGIPFIANNSISLTDLAIHRKLGVTCSWIVKSISSNIIFLCNNDFYEKSAIEYFENTLLGNIISEIVE